MYALEQGALVLLEQSGQSILVCLVEHSRPRLRLEHVGAQRRQRHHAGAPLVEAAVQRGDRRLRQRDQLGLRRVELLPLALAIACLLEGEHLESAVIGGDPHGMSQLQRLHDRVVVHRIDGGPVAQRVGFEHGVSHRPHHAGDVGGPAAAQPLALVAGELLRLGDRRLRLLGRSQRGGLSALHHAAGAGPPRRHERAVGVVARGGALEEQVVREAEGLVIRVEELELDGQVGRLDAGVPADAFEDFFQLAQMKYLVLAVEHLGRLERHRHVLERSLIERREWLAHSVDPEVADEPAVQQARGVVRRRRVDDRGLLAEVVQRDPGGTQQPLVRLNVGAHGREVRSCHVFRHQTRSLDADARSRGVHTVVELQHVDDDRIGQRPVVTRVQQILEDAAQHIALKQLGPLLGEAGGQLVRSLDHRGCRAHQVVEEELVARVEVLDALERGFVGCQDRVPRDRGHDRALQRVRNHSPRSLLPLGAGEVRQPVAEPGILGAHLRDDIEAGNLGDQPTVVHHVLSDPCAHLLAGVVPIRLPRVLESVGPQDLGGQPVVQLGVEGLHDLMSSGDLVVGQPTLGCSGELHDRQLDELPVLLGERVRRRCRLRAHLDAQLLPHRIEHGGGVVGDRLRRIVGVFDLERLRRGHFGERSQVADGSGRLDHRLLGQVARLVLRQDRHLRLRGHRSRQHTGVTHGVMAIGGSVDHREVAHHRP